MAFRIQNTLEANILDVPSIHLNSYYVEDLQVGFENITDIPKDEDIVSV